MATGSVFGNISEFDSRGEDWHLYVERLEQFFVANEVKDKDRQRAIFLTVCGQRTYTLLRSLIQPAKPTDKTLKEILQVLEKHFAPKPSVVVERCHFNERIRKDGESISDYVAELRKMTEYCEYGDKLEEMIRDRLVAGVMNDNIQQKLFSESQTGELTYKKAVDISLSIEAAQNHMAVLKHNGKTPVQERIHQVEVVSEVKSSNKVSTNCTKCKDECFRCGGAHDCSTCKFAMAECHLCGNIGHIQRKCKLSDTQKNKSGRDEAMSQSAPRYFGKGKKRGRPQKANYVSAEDSGEVYTIFHLKNSKSTPYTVNIELGGKSENMQIDTGASVSILSETTYNSIKDNIGSFYETHDVLQTYTGEKIPVLGKVMVPVKYGKQDCIELQAIVVKGDGPDLIGRNWLQHIRLNWQQIFSVNLNNAELQKVLDKHADVFEEGLGTLKGASAKIYVEPDAKPRYFKPRSVPYAQRSGIEKELARLEEEGIICKVQFSDWAAPIVPVTKQNGSIRICGDYKVTVNQVQSWTTTQYPRLRIFWLS